MKWSPVLNACFSSPFLGAPVEPCCPLLFGSRPVYYVVMTALLTCSEAHTLGAVEIFFLYIPGVDSVGSVGILSPSVSLTLESRDFLFWKN